MLDSYRYPAANRPVAMGVNGMVSSAHPLASLAGVQVMTEGGNAFDAVVAVASTLNVVEPYMSGVGGIGLALAHVASEGRVRALNFSGRMPRAATPDKFTTESLEQGILAPLIPGNLAGWLTLHETYGTMDRERLFRQAISYAENGFPITFVNSEIMHQTAEHLRRFPKSAQTILDGSGAAHPPGTRLVWPDLARTLRLIADQGADVFYRGEIAEGIVKASEEMNGLFTMDDLADYETEWQEPISVEYNGYRIFTTPPNSSGFQVLQTLKMMEGSDPRYQSVDTLHRFMESVKLAVTDRIEWAGDPDYVTVPLAGLLSDEYAAAQRDRIDMATVSTVRGERYADPSPDNPLRPGDPGGVRGRDDDPLRRGRPRRQRGDCHADPRRRIRLQRHCRRHGCIPEQHGVILRAGRRQPKPNWPVEASGLRRCPDTDVQGRQVPPQHRHSRRVRHSADHTADAHERARLRNERAAGHRGPALQVHAGDARRDGRTTPLAHSPRPGAEGPRGRRRGGVFEARRWRAGHTGRPGAGDVPGRGGPPAATALP